MSTAPKRKRTLLFIGIGVLALLIIAAAVKARKNPKGEPVKMETIGRHTIRETVSASGKIFPETEVKIAADVSGEVVELYVKEGDSVKAGQVLAKIRPDEYQSAYEQGRAAVSSARAQRGASSSNVESSKAQIEQLRAERNRVAAQLEQVRSAHARSEDLFKAGVIAKAEFETSLSSLRTTESALAAADAALRASEGNLSGAQANVQAAESGIVSAQARLKELQSSLDKTIITAPVGGIISKLNVERGERVVGTLQMAGTEVLRIANLNSMEVQVEVSENDILKVSLGDEADIEVDAYVGRLFKGKVSEIASSANNITSSAAASSLNTDQVTNFIVKIRINPDSYADLTRNGAQSPFRPGMSASVDIYTSVADSILAVPIIAVTAREKEEKKEKTPEKETPANESTKPASRATEPTKEIVFVVVGDTVAVREVKTGIQDNDYIEVISGLQEGETVVSGPYSAIARKLKSGMRVRKQEEKSTDKDKKEKTD